MRGNTLGPVDRTVSVLIDRSYPVVKAVYESLDIILALHESEDQWKFLYSNWDKIDSVSQAAQNVNTVIENLAEILKSKYYADEAKEASIAAETAKGIAYDYMLSAEQYKDQTKELADTVVYFMDELETVSTDIDSIIANAENIDYIKIIANDFKNQTTEAGLPDLGEVGVEHSLGEIPTGGNIVTLVENIEDVNTVADNIEDVQKVADSIDSFAQQIETAATKAITSVETAGSTQVGQVTAEGTKQIGLVQAEGAEQVSLVQEKGTEQVTLATEQATIATTKAGEASTSAGNAKTSETNAKTSETNAKASETLARRWAVETETPIESDLYGSIYYAQKASDASNAATNSASEASGYASSAETSKNAAAQSATQAADSASSASTSATTATQQQGLATTAASNAQTSATNAAKSAQDAEAWASYMDAPVDKFSYSAKFYAQQAIKAVDNANASAEKAETQATTATTKAQEAADSASQASTHYNNAVQAANLANQYKDTVVQTAGEVETDATTASNAASQAQTSATNASSSATTATNQANLAKDWAIKLDAKINDEDYSSKYYAQQAQTAGTSSVDAINVAKTQALTAIQSQQSTSVQAVTTTASEKLTQMQEQVALATEQAELAEGYANQAATGQIQADWSVTDTSSKAFIKNKPDVYTKAETYSKTEVDNKLVAVYVYKGSVDSEINLPQEGNVVGWVYDVQDTGANYAWNGVAWDKLGANIDLSPYATTDYVTDALTSKLDTSTFNSEKTALIEQINSKVSTSTYTTDKATFATKTELAQKADSTTLGSYLTTSDAESIYATKTEMNQKADSSALGSYLTTATAASTYLTITSGNAYIESINQQISTINTTLNGKANTSDTHTASQVTDLTTTLAPYIKSNAWNQVDISDSASWKLLWQGQAVGQSDVTSTGFMMEVSNGDPQLTIQAKVGAEWGQIVLTKNNINFQVGQGKYIYVSDLINTIDSLSTTYATKSEMTTNLANKLDITTFEGFEWGEVGVS